MTKGGRQPPLVAGPSCDHQRWRYGAGTANASHSVTLSAPQAASTGAASHDAASWDAAVQDGVNTALNPPRPDFPATAPAANPVFYRTYSRKLPSGRESWRQVADRNLEGCAAWDISTTTR